MGRLTAKHALGIVLLTAVLLLATVLPFVPGPYDPLAVPLSTMAQVAGLASLLLVPVAAALLIHERVFRTRSSMDAWPVRRRYARVAFGIGVLTVVAVSLAAAVSGGISLGVLVFVLLGLGLIVARRRLDEALQSDKTARVFLAYLILVPILVFTLQLVAMGPAADFGRSRVIRNSAELIAELERYRSERGAYPLSMLSANEDYRPGVMGVLRFLYEPTGDGYNLAFEQRSTALDTREFVVFNPKGNAYFTSHNADLLTFRGVDLELRRGFYASRETPHANWKSFLFD